MSQVEDVLVVVMHEPTSRHRLEVPGRAATDADRFDPGNMVLQVKSHVIAQFHHDLERHIRAAVRP